mmetsp:Transcript_18438/g.53168  ORF Transcript_18438/g.53168 Transcript_18438/m.53168 type:complete len:81 (-) Transcript_18438:841-1083(-)
MRPPPPPPDSGGRPLRPPEVFVTLQGLFVRSVLVAESPERKAAGRGRTGYTMHPRMSDPILCPDSIRCQFNGDRQQRSPG